MFLLMSLMASVCKPKHPLGVSIELDSIYPTGVIGQVMKQATKTSVLRRLSRIEGQVRGISGMVEGDRYCVDVVTQISAVRAALHKVEAEILRDHVSHCVAGAFASGRVNEQRKKLEELIDTIGRMSRQRPAT